MTITVTEKDDQRTAMIKFKGNPKTEIVGEQAFMLKDSKLLCSEWALCVVVSQSSPIEYFRHLFRKSRFLQEVNPIFLYLIIGELLACLFTIVVQKKIAGPAITNPLTQLLITRCIHLNFHLPLIYIIYDVLDIVFTLVRLWRSVLEKDYFLESENNL